MRTLKEIATEIQADWLVINNAGAKDALECMKRMGLITEPFGTDPNGYSIVGSFLANATGWHGVLATRIKKELKQCVATRGHSMPPLFQLRVRSRWTRRLRRVHESEHWTS